MPVTMTIVPVAHARRYPPRVTEFTAPFWLNLTQGLFSTTRCRSCHRLSFPPKPICPHCWKDEIDWEVLPTLGSLYSWTRIHAGPAVFAGDLPYVVGIIDLEIGIRLGCSLVEQREPWLCDIKMELVTLSFADGPLLGARPVSAIATH